MKLIGYKDSSIKNPGSNLVFLYLDNEKYKILCEVVETSSHMTLGRAQALRMIYLDFLHNQEPTVSATPGKTIKAVQKEHVKATTEPVRPVI